MQKSISEEEKQYSTLFSEWLLPEVKFAQCPIKASLGVLGKKWTLLVLRDIGILGIKRFNRILDSIPGLTPKVLSMRLKELEKEGFIQVIEKEKPPHACCQMDFNGEGKGHPANLVPVYSLWLKMAP